MTATTAERPFTPAPLSEDEVLDPQWLSQALSVGRAPVTVRSVELVQTIGWNCLTLRVKVTYDGGPRPDLPEQLCIKGLFGVHHPEYLENGVLVAEANFYRLCAEQTGMFAPRCYYTGVDEASGAGVVILEDLNAVNVRFFSGRDAFDDDMVHQSVEQLARLHGWSWNRTEADYPWVQNKLVRFVTTAKVSPERLTEAMQGSRGVGLPEALKDGQRFYDGLTKLAERSTRISSNFIHGDVHPGNTFQVAGRMGLIDWQIMQRGSWSLDLAYHLGSTLTVEDRRAKEQDLLRFYLDRLAAHGGTPPEWETAWRLYRESVPYGFYLWAVTMRVDQDIIDSCVQRLGTSAADHGSYELLGV